MLSPLKDITPLSFKQIVDKLLIYIHPFELSISSLDPSLVSEITNNEYTTSIHTEVAEGII
jgi:hypothetical protein